MVFGAWHRGRSFAASVVQFVAPWAQLVERDAKLEVWKSLLILWRRGRSSWWGQFVALDAHCDAWGPDGPAVVVAPVAQ
jgi:hypothetical protein